MRFQVETFNYTELVSQILFLKIHIVLVCILNMLKTRKVFKIFYNHQVFNDSESIFSWHAVIQDIFQYYLSQHTNRILKTAVIINKYRVYIQ